MFGLFCSLKMLLQGVLVGMVEDEEVQGVGICIVLSVEAVCWILFLPSLDYLMNFVEFLNLLGEVAILGLALSPVDDCTARHDSAEDCSRLGALLFTAMAWIFIPAHCFANP